MLGIEVYLLVAIVVAVHLQRLGLDLGREAVEAGSVRLKQGYPQQSVVGRLGSTIVLVIPPPVMVSPVTACRRGGGHRHIGLYTNSLNTLTA